MNLAARLRFIIRILVLQRGPLLVVSLYVLHIGFLSSKARSAPEEIQSASPSNASSIATDSLPMVSRTFF